MQWCEVTDRVGLFAYMGRAFAIHMMTQQTPFRDDDRSFSYAVTEACQYRRVKEGFQSIELFQKSLVFKHVGSSHSAHQGLNIKSVCL